MRRVPDDLAGRTCIVTGGGSGLGAATVEIFAEAGARVIAVDRSFPQGAVANPMVERVEADVSEQQVPRDLASQLDQVDVVACFAGISLGGRLESISDAVWRTVLDVNVVGTARWIASFLPQLRASGHSSVITVASQLALAGGKGNPSYIASKGAVLSLTRCLAMDYASDNIRVNCIVPGAIDTPMLQRSFARAERPDELRATSLARHPLGRFGKSREVAEAALFLASDRSSFTTGIILPVDGGWLAA